MSVDWFTVVAQILNFLVLVWLLKRFLYKPVLDAIDAREARIAAELSDAATQQSDADAQQREYLRKNAEIDAQQDKLLKQATAEADDERQRLLDDARSAADRLRKEREEILENELQTLHETITRQSRREVFATTRKVLAELADTTLEARMSERFIERLQQIDAATVQRIKPAPDSAETATIRSAFELDSAQQKAIKRAITERFGADIDARFEVTGDLVAGIELVLQGHKIAWSVAEYLGEMEKNLSDTLGDTEPGFTS